MQKMSPRPPQDERKHYYDGLRDALSGPCLESTKLLSVLGFYLNWELKHVSSEADSVECSGVWRSMANHIEAADQANERVLESGSGV